MLVGSVSELFPKSQLTHSQKDKDGSTFNGVQWKINRSLPRNKVDLRVYHPGHILC